MILRDFVFVQYRFPVGGCDLNQALADHGTRWVAEVFPTMWSISMNLYVHTITYEHVV
jgi:hypothetical protein